MVTVWLVLGVVFPGCGFPGCGFLGVVSLGVVLTPVIFLIARVQPRGGAKLRLTIIKGNFILRASLYCKWVRSRGSSIRYIRDVKICLSLRLSQGDSLRLRRSKVGYYGPIIGQYVVVESSIL